MGTLFGNGKGHTNLLLALTDRTLNHEFQLSDESVKVLTIMIPRHDIFRTKNSQNHIQLRSTAAFFSREKSTVSYEQTIM